MRLGCQEFPSCFDDHDEGNSGYSALDNDMIRGDLYKLTIGASWTV